MTEAAPLRMPVRRLGLLLAGLGIAAGIAALLAWPDADPGAPWVHVRWAESIDDAARADLEQRFSLRSATPLQGTVFGYFLDDTSTANVEALVRHQAVLDTQDLDRGAFVVSATADREPLTDADAAQQARRAARARLLLAVAVVLLSAGGVAVARPAAATYAAARSRAWLATRAVPWLDARIPEATPQAVAAFRMALATGVLAMTLVLQPALGDPLPAATQPGSPAYLQAAFEVARATPGFLLVVQAWLVGAAILFGAGAFVRVTYPLLVAGVVVWALVYLFRYGGHPVTAPVVMLLMLLPSRWADAWSLDARRRRPVPVAPRRYGYTLWVPAVVAGVLLFAAAASKLRFSGFDWIADGAVRYHFLTDSPQAPLDWGLRIVEVPGLAVALSAGAVLVELLVLPAVLAGRYALRAAAGLATAVLLVGFWLFQGLFWPGWWLLLVAFLPWHRLGRPVSLPPVAQAGRRLGVVQLAIVLALAAQQLVASARDLEVPPLLSAYDMYSNTFDGPAHYEEATTRGYWVVASDARGVLGDCAIDAEDASRVENGWRDGGPEAADAARAVLARCFTPEVAWTTVHLEATRMQVDWERWRLLGETRVGLGDPLPRDALR